MSIDHILLSASTKDLESEDIRELLHEHYDDIESMVRGVAEDKFHLILNGNAGMGKTEFTNDILKMYNGKRQGYPTIHKPKKLSGTTSGIALFAELQKTNEKGQITIIDDTDKVLEDTEMIDLLKGCLDTQEGKEVAWGKYSTALKAEDLDKSFVYQGRVIIITNKRLQFADDNTPTLARQRLEPLLDRCVYFRAGLPSVEFKMEAIWMFFNGYKKHRRYQLRCFKTPLEGYPNGVPEDVQLEIIEFMDEHKKKFKFISFRQVAQLVSLWEHDKDKWKRHAMRTMFK
jgi:hypothetical protein